MTLATCVLLVFAGSGLLALLPAGALQAQQDTDRRAAWSGAWEAQNQVTSVSQFSDVRPTDWAYQALSNLVERYGCVAGYPGHLQGRPGHDPL
jgi:hypothetical protein